MTEQEAIERIVTAMRQCERSYVAVSIWLDDEQIEAMARRAWGEMKVIACEESQSEQAIHERTLADIGRTAFNDHFKGNP